jgi:cephalosporin hydroxylase
MDRFASSSGQVPPELTATDIGQMFDSQDGRICIKWAHYLPIYDRLFGPLRGTEVRLLEIGVHKGGSLQLWRNYLGPDAKIHGVDIDPECAKLSSDDLPVHIGSQADPDFLEMVVNQMGGVDVVLDDGSHVAKHQRASFDALFPRLSVGGLYIIEDTHTAYWARHGGGYRRPGTAIEMSKGLVDGMHGWYHRVPLGRRGRWAKEQIGSISFYDSMVVIEKCLRSRPIVEERGDKSL